MNFHEILNMACRVILIVFAVTGVWSNDLRWLLFSIFLWIVLDYAERPDSPAGTDGQGLS